MWHTRTVIQAPYWDGQSCGALWENATCNENPCPQDCDVSEWSDWGSCDKDCGGEAPGTRLYGAKQERTRYIKTPAQWGGLPCPTLSQTKLCALHPCGSHVCTVTAEQLAEDPPKFPLTCTYENDIVYTHHVNDVHDDEMFMCYHNIVTEVCTCLCWPSNEADGDATNNAYTNTFKVPASGPAESDISTFTKWQSDSVQGESPTDGVRLSHAGGDIENGVFTSGGDGITNGPALTPELHDVADSAFGVNGQQAHAGDTPVYTKTSDADFNSYKKDSAWYNKWLNNQN